jgi:hypothetical protein
MTADEMRKLKPTDLIRHKAGHGPMIVHANYGNHCVAVQTSYVSNPGEWDRVHPDGSVKTAEEE